MKIIVTLEYEISEEPQGEDREILLENIHDFYDDHMHQAQMFHHIITNYDVNVKENKE